MQVDYPCRCSISTLVCPSLHPRVISSKHAGNHGLSTAEFVSPIQWGAEWTHLRTDSLEESGEGGQCHCRCRHQVAPAAWKALLVGEAVVLCDRASRKLPEHTERLEEEGRVQRCAAVLFADQQSRQRAGFNREPVHTFKEKQLVRRLRSSNATAQQRKERHLRTSTGCPKGQKEACLREAT